MAYKNHIVISGAEEKYAVYMYRGSDEPDVPGSDGRPRGNVIYDNQLISDNYAIKMMDTDNNVIKVRPD